MQKDENCAVLAFLSPEKKIIEISISADLPTDSNQFTHGAKQALKENFMTWEPEKMIILGGLGQAKKKLNKLREKINPGDFQQRTQNLVLI